MEQNKSACTIDLSGFDIASDESEQKCEMKTFSICLMHDHSKPYYVLSLISCNKLLNQQFNSSTSKDAEHTKQKKSFLFLLRHPHNFCFDLSMNVSICVTSETSSRKSNLGYTFAAAVSFQDVGFLDDLDLR